MSEYIIVVEEKVCPLPTEHFKERKTWVFSVSCSRIRYSNYYRETLKSPRHRKWDLQETLYNHRMRDKIPIKAELPDRVIEDAIRQAKERIKYIDD